MDGPPEFPDLWRWGILATAGIGFAIGLIHVAARRTPTVEFAGRTFTKRQALLGLTAWNAIGLPLLAVYLFTVWRA